MSYFQITRLPDGSHSKPGVRGFPRLDPMQALLLGVLEDFDLQGARTAFDLTARGGAVALDLAGRGLEVTATDGSAAASRALLEAQGAGVRVLPAAALESGPSGADLASVILPADRGNALVRFLVARALDGVRLGGRVLVAGDKDRGFDRYFKEAAKLAGGGEVLERSKGLRVGVLEKSRTAPEASLEPERFSPERFSIEARGRTLHGAALPGVFSSGKLDAASKLLLEHLPPGAGRRVLDLGAGYGALAAFLAFEGARVTMLEDDWLSVRSCEQTFAANGLEGEALHSDVDAALGAEERFDLIVTNPPFHVGADLVLDVALEFIRAAGRRASAGGEVWLVANHFLPYEAELSRLGPVREVARAHGFKVLSATRA